MFQPDNHHHYSSIFPSSSSIRDVISVVFIIQSLPKFISFLLLVVYIILGGGSFMGGKFLINLFLIKSSKLTKPWKYYASNLGKLFVVDSMIYVVLIKYTNYETYFNYLIILAHSILASELIGVNSINYINTITLRKITTKIQYDNILWFINQRFINGLICFVIVNYIIYIINWLNSTLQFNVITTTTTTRNFHFDYLYLTISIHIILQTICVKNSSILTNSIPNLSDEISINVDDSKLLDIDFTTLRTILPTPNKSIELKNFENFIISPINNRFTKIDKLITTTSKTMNPNVTTINNKIIIQPFWNIIAALKLILKNKYLFNSTVTDIEQFENSLKVSIVLCDTTRVILQLLDNTVQDLTVKLNDINWMSYKLVNNYLIIYDLSPSFKYDIVLYSNCQPVNKTAIVTTIRTITSINSGTIGTIQTSLSTTMIKLSQLRNKFKKFKRDENKRISELRNSIDIIKARLTKTHSPKYNDIRLIGKIKGLKQTVIQLELDINNLLEEINQLTKQEYDISLQFEIKDEIFVEKCQILEVEYDEYLSRINKSRIELKNIKLECQTILGKNHKLKIKQLNKQDEIKQLINELNDIKNQEILIKFTNRIKKTNDKFEYILPKLIHETEILSKMFTN